MAVIWHKNNLCVQTTTERPGSSSGFIRCKTIAPVENLAAARQIAYRLIHKIDNVKTVSIRTTPKGRRKETRYYFNKLHGIIDCRVGSAYGRRCK
jgi:hypothetical protein